jgi:poly-gamma-glutamate synthesis protein (capsule biosynthesis protein)
MKNKPKKICVLQKITMAKKILIFFLLTAVTFSFSCSFTGTLKRKSEPESFNSGSNSENVKDFSVKNETSITAENTEKEEVIILKLDEALPDHISTILKNKTKKLFDKVIFEKEKIGSKKNALSDEAIEDEITINADIAGANESFNNYIIICAVSNFFSPRDSIEFSEIESFLNTPDELTKNGVNNQSPGKEQDFKKDGDLSQADRLYISNDVGNIFKKFYGEVKNKNVIFADNFDIFRELSQNTDAIALISFESLKKEVKVLNINGKSIFGKKFSHSDYPLSFSVNFSGNDGGKILKVREAFEKDFYSNMDPSKLAAVNVTGVTALVRGVANRMDKKGILYPAEKIAEILRDSDITHISNEISFKENCNAGQSGTTFCSKPEYIELLRFVGTDVVELTGNHLNDYGSKYLEDTISMYDKEGWKYFGGGLNLNLSRQPALFDINGNKIAFLGFNQFGPSYDWATDTQAGSAPPDNPFYISEIKRLKAEGYSVIFTFQYEEAYQYSPLVGQIDDFRLISDAGADIVSGSQAHHPMGLELNSSGLICYGLGNLFFDQMQSLGTRQGLIAKHIFYDNKYISTQLIPTLIEDYCQPRLMEGSEKEEFLSIIYNKSIKHEN